MNIMSKRGRLDNVVTYQHICDTMADLENIDKRYATLGSTAIVLTSDEGLRIFMATSEGEWIEVLGGSGGAAESILGQKTITQNGTYSAVEDGLDGYSEVNVEVASPATYPAGWQKQE